MTVLYFIRHAEPDYNNHDDTSRPLTEKGRLERALATAYLWDKNIEVVLSSPFLRAYDTVADFAARKGLAIHTDDDFRERAVSNRWETDWQNFTQNQWRDFDYKLPGGESLNETQARNMAALQRAVSMYPDKNIAVGSHGTALSVIIQYFDPSYGHADFRAMAHKMPWAVKLTMDGEVCLSIEKTDLTVRAMAATDYEKVSALWAASAGLGKTAADDSPEAIARFLERNPGLSQVVEIGGDIIGALLCGHDGRRASIYHAAAHASYRGLGIGKVLVGAALRALKEVNIRKVSVTVFESNTQGDAFWAEEGFTRRDDLIFRNRTVPGME